MEIQAAVSPYSHDPYGNPVASVDMDAAFPRSGSSVAFAHDPYSGEASPTSSDVNLFVANSKLASNKLELFRQKQVPAVEVDSQSHSSDSSPSQTMMHLPNFDGSFCATTPTASMSHNPYMHHGPDASFMAGQPAVGVQTSDPAASFMAGQPAVHAASPMAWQAAPFQPMQPFVHQFHVASPHAVSASTSPPSLGPHSPTAQPQSPAHAMTRHPSQPFVMPNAMHVAGPMVVSPPFHPSSPQRAAPAPAVVPAQVLAPMGAQVEEKTLPAQDAKVERHMVGEALGIVWSRRGLRLNRVLPNSPAEQSGLAKFTGHTLLKVDGQEVSRVRDVTALTDGMTEFTLTFDGGAATERLPKKPRMPITGLPRQVQDAAKMPTVVSVVFKFGRVAEVGSTLPVEHFASCKGQAWLVEAAKGLDLCEVLYARPNDTPATAPQYRMCREATEEEVHRAQVEFATEEAEAFRFLLDKAKRLRSKVWIHACEFQIDRMKLTIHYSSSEKKPDFKQLVYEAFKEYRVRIWMNNCKPTDGQPGAALNPDLLPPRPCDSKKKAAPTVAQ
eukprot:TRINITY_DN4574_c0_g1_i1.p1 TRINITY_DN4574_c0_g1~~TRINITY_DN4574_c0_g1_i1.p1  ORF type:complete len:556 (+),score=211.52 TRINITY_DN4574_c0_g1_i1:52-1719(+)